LRQGVPARQVDDVVALASTFPPARVVIVFGDLGEAELLVVIGADPFGGIDRAFLQRRIDIAAGDLLRHAADLGDDGSGEAADAEFQSLETRDRLDLFPDPAAHLGTGAASRNAEAIVLLEEVIEQILPATPRQP